MYAMFLMILAMVYLQTAEPMPGWQVVTAFVGGAFGRILIPYGLEWLNKLQEDETKLSFDYKYVIGQILAVAIMLIPTVFVDSWMAGLAKMSVVSAVSFGWFSADVGREGQKAADILRKWRNGG